MMDHGKLVAEYWKTHGRLAEIGAEFYMSPHDLARNLSTLPIETQNRVRPLFWRQLKNIEELRRYRLSSFQNVLILPISHRW